MFATSLGNCCNASMPRLPADVAHLRVSSSTQTLESVHNVCAVAGRLLEALDERSCHCDKGSLGASRHATEVTAPLLRDCAQTFRFTADPPTFLVPCSPHISVDSPDCSSDDSGAGMGGGAGDSADFLDEGCLDSADADAV